HRARDAEPALRVHGAAARGRLRAAPRGRDGGAPLAGGGAVAGAAGRVSEHVDLARGDDGAAGGAGVGGRDGGDRKRVGWGGGGGGVGGGGRSRARCRAGSSSSWGCCSRPTSRCAART